MKFKSITLIGLAVCCALSCKKNSNTDPEVITDPLVTVQTNLNNEVLLKLVNDTRAAGCNCGTTVMPPVPTLAWNNQLAAAAVGHSKYMASVNTMTHNSADGKTFGDRITAAGYVWTTAGENVAQGQTTEAQVFNDWIKSEGHCKNIMNAKFKEMGAGRQGNFWTQDFAAK